MIFLDSLWPNLADISEITTPKEILEEQGKFLENITDGHVYGSVEEVGAYDDIVDKLDPEITDFIFKFALKSKFLERYSFTLFAFTHAIEIYPVRLQLDYKIAEELGFDKKTTSTSVNDQDEFTILLKKIFNTERTKLVIAAISKLSNI